VTGPRLSGPRVYKVLRVVETVLLVTSLAGIASFALSIFAILRIESAPGAAAATDLTREIPWSAWYGIFIFFGSMILLQVVRVWLHRHRREDGTARADARGQAAAATADALREPSGETPGRDDTLMYSDDDDAEPPEGGPGGPAS
jgi:hypothetical protein